MSCTVDQAKRFFATMCFATENIEAFQKTLNTFSENDWPTVFLASVVIENCGLKKIQEKLITTVLQDNINSKSQSDDYWVSVPNEYILRDRAWLIPVIRACDPGKVVFKEDDYGLKLINDLCEKLSINLRTRELPYSDNSGASKDVIEVNLSHLIRVIMLILENPDQMGVSRTEFENIFRSALNDECYNVLQKRTGAVAKPDLVLALEVPSEKQDPSLDTKSKEVEGELEDEAEFETAYNASSEEFSKGLMLLAILTLTFVASSLLGGYCYRP